MEGVEEVVVAVLIIDITDTTLRSCFWVHLRRPANSAEASARILESTSEETILGTTGIVSKQNTLRFPHQVLRLPRRGRGGEWMTQAEKGAVTPSPTTSEITLHTPDPSNLARIDVEKAGHVVGTTLSEEEWIADSRNPRNWPSRQKWKNALIISITGFLSTCGSSILVPSAPTISLQFSEPNSQIVTLTTALYVFGLGAGPFVFAPVSELKGRRFAYGASMVGFFAVNLGCIFARSLPSLIILRFFAGFFGSSGPGLGVATISDLFAPRERGRPISVYAIGPLMGPFLGSVIGSYIVLYDWRWCFILMTILVGINTLVLVFAMEETYAEVVKSQIEKIDQPSSKEERRNWWSLGLSPEAREVVVRTFTGLMKRVGQRPPRMLANPVCLIFILYYSYVYSIIYVFLITLPLLYAVDQRSPPTGLFSYRWSDEFSGLAFFGLGVGFLASAATASLVQDKIYGHLCQRNGDEGKPEYRLPLTQIGMFILPLGLLLWGWTAELHTHPAGPLIGSAVLAFGLMLAFNSIQNWIVDAFYPYAAAAMAAASLLRSITGCLLPLFADRLFLKLSYGKGGTLLAGISLLALPAPWVLFRYGGALRERFRFVP